MAIAAADPATPGGVIPVCPTKALLGINCPGCGSMRMIQCISQLRFNDALRYNALGFLFVLLLAWSWGAWMLRTRGFMVADWLNWRFAPQFVLVLTIAWFVIRLLPFEPFLHLRV
ncbi:DUF2752 domain-containing protein [Corynebacterium sp. H128]